MTSPEPVTSPEPLTDPGPQAPGRGLLVARR